MLMLVRCGGLVCLIGGGGGVLVLVGRGVRGRPGSRLILVSWRIC